MRSRRFLWLLLVVGLASVLWTRRRALISLVDSRPQAVNVAQTIDDASLSSSSTRPSPPLPLMVPSDGGICPETHPIKANPISHIYHLPHHRMYQRLTKVVCYTDEQAAQAEGYRASKQ